MAWQEEADAAPRRVAAKLFKGTITSDGATQDEMAAMLAIGHHPNLTAPLGRVADHPEGVEGLVMPLLPEGWKALAGPPSLESCTRDAYDPALRLPWPAALRLAQGAAEALGHLHARGLIHGDLYAHNLLWDGAAGQSVLSDFGAAAFCPRQADPLALQGVEMRAFGILASEIAALCDEASRPLADLASLCMQPEIGARPTMAAVSAELARL